MRHLKFHPILESTADAKSILKLIDETESGRDLKAICDLDPKNSGRVYVKPIGLGGSKTYIEKDKLGGKYKFAVLSNGVPFNIETYDTLEETFRMLWSYILSKNVPAGFSKKSFRNWAANPSNSVYGKKLSSIEIVSIFMEETGNPDMIKSYKGYFAEPEIKEEIEKIGIVITPHMKGFQIKYGPNQITKCIDAATSFKGRIEGNSTIIVILNSAKPMFKEDKDNDMRITVGSRFDDVRKVEIKILEKLKNYMEQRLKILQSSSLYAGFGPALEEENASKLLNIGMKIGINAISKIITGNGAFDISDEFDGLVGLSSSEMSIIRRESPDILWPELLKRMDPEIANVSSDLGDLGF